MPHNEQHSFSPELNWKIRLVDETNGGVEIEKKKITVVSQSRMAFITNPLEILVDLISFSMKIPNT